MVVVMVLVMVAGRVPPVPPVATRLMAMGPVPLVIPRFVR
jgi:hypothetical protein